MLIKFDGENLNYFYCTCSDWSTIVLAENENEAAKKALLFILEDLNDEANISAAIRVKKISEKLEMSDNLIRMDEVLSDIGMHKESRALREIFNK